MSGRPTVCRNLVHSQVPHQSGDRVECIPIKHRWLKSYNPTSDREGGLARSSSSFRSTDVHESHSQLTHRNHTEKLDARNPSRITEPHVSDHQRLVNQSYPQLNGDRHKSLHQSKKRSRDVPDFPYEGAERYGKQVRDSSSSVLDKQSVLPFQIPSSTHYSYANGAHTSQHKKDRIFEQRDASRRITNISGFQKAAHVEESSQQLGDSLLEQCLRRGSGKREHSKHLQCQDILQHGDHTKLSIGVRTQLDKMRDDKLLALYLHVEGLKEKQRNEQQFPNSKSRQEVNGTMSTLMANQDMYWSGWESLGFDAPMSRAELMNDSLRIMPTQQSLLASRLDELSKSIIPQNMDRVETDLKTISVRDIFVQSTTPKQSVNFPQSTERRAADQTSVTRNESQMGNHVADGTIRNNLGSVVLRQPKIETPDVLPQCFMSTSNGFFSPGTASTPTVKQEIERNEDEISLHEITKREADSAESPNGNAKSEIPCKNSSTVKFKRPEDNKCPICTDEISGYHYGTYSCESCKGFFKRTIQNRRNERLVCSFMGNCQITLQNRKHCAFCRYKRCLDTGMKHHGENKIYLQF